MIPSQPNLLCFQTHYDAYHQVNGRLLSAFTADTLSDLKIASATQGTPFSAARRPRPNLPAETSRRCACVIPPPSSTCTRTSAAQTRVAPADVVLGLSILVLDISAHAPGTCKRGPVLNDTTAKWPLSFPAAHHPDIPQLKLKLELSLEASARHSLPSHPTAIMTRLALDPGAGPRRCAIGQDVMQKVYTLMQDLMLCLIIPLVVLRELSSFCLAAPHPSSRSRPSIALVSSICGTIAIQPHPPRAQRIHDSDRWSRSSPVQPHCFDIVTDFGYAPSICTSSVSETLI
ncbi:hypothetical protein C8Q76DRAFT_228406 [Earliella scabrosa]|nr:hypothetical protein C8Q76DRAFT_228406 [Earliella scabrosa]